MGYSFSYKVYDNNAAHQSNGGRNLGAASATPHDNPLLVLHQSKVAVTNRASTIASQSEGSTLPNIGLMSHPLRGVQEIVETNCPCRNWLVRPHIAGPAGTGSFVPTSLGTSLASNLLDSQAGQGHVHAIVNHGSCRA